MTLVPSSPAGGPTPSAKTIAIARLVHGFVSAVQARAAPVTAARMSSSLTPGNPARCTVIGMQGDASRYGTPALVCKRT